LIKNLKALLYSKEKYIFIRFELNGCKTSISSFFRSDFFRPVRIWFFAEFLLYITGPMAIFKSSGETVFR